MIVDIIVWNKYCWVKTNDPAILLKIYELLSYEIKQNRFNPKSGIHSFLSKKNAFKTGFLPFVYSNLTAAGYQVLLQDQRKNRFEISQEEIFTVIPEGELRARQVDATHKSFDPDFKDILWYRGILHAATNFGKNWQICALVKTVLPKSKVVVTVHRKELFNQLYDFLTANHVPVHRYGTYKNKTYKELGHVTLIMPTTIEPETDTVKVKTFMQDVGVLIVDECHRAAASNYYKLLFGIDAFAVWYLSGTPFTNNIEHDMNMVGDSSLVIAKISNSDLISDGVSQKPVVYFYRVKGVDLSLNFNDEKQNIIQCPYRLEVMKQVILNKIDDIYLISVATKEHGYYLLKHLITLPTTVDFIYSGDPQRTEKLNAYKVGDIKVLITTEVLKEGVNLPLIRTLINAAWGKSIVWVKQFVGRVLRSDDTNKQCTIIDFIDMGMHTRAHSLDRYAIYKKENFEIIEY